MESDYSQEGPSPQAHFRELFLQSDLDTPTTTTLNWRRTLNELPILRIPTTRKFLQCLMIGRICLELHRLGCGGDRRDPADDTVLTLQWAEVRGRAAVLRH